MAFVASDEDPAARYREFTREMILRFEGSMRAVVAEMREASRLQRAELAQLRSEFRAHDERESRRTDELIEESRAQRQALLRILARLDGGGPAAAT